MTSSPHVVVIGAGTLGMCTAINLSEQGARVTVVEAQAIASGSSGRSVGVVLGGGAARAFAHVGVVRALREAGVPIDILGGTSAGGSFAAAFAREYNYDRAIDIVGKGIDAMLANFTIPLVSLTTGRDVLPYVRRNIGDLHIEDLWLRFFCISANLTRASVQVHDRGNLGRALLATGRLPAIHWICTEPGKASVVFAVHRVDQAGTADCRRLSGFARFAAPLPPPAAFAVTLRPSASTAG